MAILHENSRLRANPLEPELDLKYIIHQAQVRWLRPPEIWEILRNYQKYDLKLSAVPPTTPPSGSLFLFDRKVLRYFRKDGHCWRKKKDGKTVREAHERLKVGSVDVLHCYYAHGEENPNFQRRSYWMLEGSYEHIVLVHYLEVTQGSRMGMPLSLWDFTAEGGLLEAKQDEQSNSTIHTFTPTLQSHALISSPRNSEAEVTGPSSFDFVDVANSFSSKLEETGEDVENKDVDDLIVNTESSLLEQLSDRACIEDLVTQLQNTPVDLQTYMSSPKPQYNKQLNSKPQTIDISKEKEQRLHSRPIQHLDLKVDDGYHQNAACAIMQDLDGVHLSDQLQNPGIYLVPRPSAPFNTSNYGQMPKIALENQAAGGNTQVGEIKHVVKNEPYSPSWAQLLEMCNRNASVDYLLNSEKSMLQGSVSTESTTLPIQSPNRPAQTVLEAHLRAVTENNPLRAAAEVPQSSSQAWSFPRVAGTQHYLEPSNHMGKVHQKSQQHQWQEKELKNSGDGWLEKQLKQQEEMQQDEDGEIIFSGSDVQPFGATHSTTHMQPNKGAILSSEQEHLCLNKQDSLGRWWSEAISGEDDSTLLTGACESGSDWVTTFEEVSTKDYFNGKEQTQVDMGLNISISPIQKFSILDIAPDWGFAFEETKVLVNGKFLKSAIHSFQCQWSCMFGEIEVPAEVVNGGVLRCKAPPHAPGRVPFYVTSGERLACSEIREFEYREKSGLFSQSTIYSSKARIMVGKQDESLLQIRLARMLVSTPEDANIGKYNEGNAHGGSSTYDINGCEEWDSLEKMVGSASSTTELKEQLLQMLLKEELQEWLLSKVNEDTKGACILNSQGQGLLHLVAALDYDWAISPILAAGVSVNFRDVHGWTALHWAAAFGREKAVLSLLAAGAAAGPVTDPTSQHPDGRTPADLASASGHGGIAAFLAEMALTSHLKLLTIKENSESELYTISADWEGENAVQTVTEKGMNEALEARFEDQTSLRQSLRAVRNAAQTAALIRSTFRLHSFRKHEEAVVGLVDEYGMSPLQIKDIVAVRRLQKDFHGNWKKKHSSAIKIQRKFRGWKGRKEFLDLRQRVILIQAHVRGHQVRKHYKKILWSVGVLEKAVLRWRRKRVGLRNFHVEGFEKKNDMIQQNNSDEDEDFLREGRKQKELSIDKAVTRVTSMVKSSTARAQYMRLLEGSQQTIHDTQDSASVYYEGLSGHDDYVMSTEDALNPDTRYT